ncbi:hypothetical protein VTJ04DRAFT_8045 [Mycothermus thermophilus]|uniref:uncharacterized protein n=1 Tax=Humicola insolens TaxID=85995 RepID=UPI0037436548
MRINEHVAISTNKVLLVPYERRHVLTYHGWMSDPAILESTASEPLTLEEEYENQESWRASHDKLTFIVCLPLDEPTTTTSTSTSSSPASESESQPQQQQQEFTIPSGQHDSPAHMLGDVNLFLYPYEPEDAVVSLSTPLPVHPEYVVGEIDVMIASAQHRKQGYGRAAVRALVEYVLRHEREIMKEYAEDKDMADRPPRLKMLMAKVKETNEASLRLFEGLGFEQEGEVNYFGEVTVVRRRLDGWGRGVEGYREGGYERGEGEEGVEER